MFFMVSRDLYNDSVYKVLKDVEGFFIEKEPLITEVCESGGGNLICYCKANWLYSEIKKFYLIMQKVLISWIMLTSI